MTEIIWEDPPPGRGNHRPGGRTGSQHDKTAVELIANPGRWARIHAYTSRNTASNLASKISRGWISCFAPAGDFDACVRTVNYEHRVYARYLGDGAEA